MANNTENLNVNALFPELEKALTRLESVQRPDPSSVEIKGEKKNNIPIYKANTRFDAAKRIFLTFLQDTIEGNMPDIPETGFPAIQEAMQLVRDADTKLGGYFAHPQWDEISAKFIDKIDPLYDELDKDEIRVILEGRRKNPMSNMLSVRTNNNGSSVESVNSQANTIEGDVEEQGEEQGGGRRRRSKKARKTKRKQRKQRKTRRR